MLTFLWVLIYWTLAGKCEAVSPKCERAMNHYFNSRTMGTLKSKLSNVNRKNENVLLTCLKCSERCKWIMANRGSS